jgi:ABC-type phosphate transport system substrate-binding protein
MLQFPFAWADSAIFLNLPELGEVPLRLDACAVAGILEGGISNWNDSALQELNPEVGSSGCVLPATLLAAEWCGVKCYRLGAFAVATRGVQGTAPAVRSTRVLCAPTRCSLSCLTCPSPSSTSTSAHPS